MTATGDQLDVDAPDGLLTDELLHSLRDHKAELLDLLRLEPDAEVCPVCHGAVQEQRGKHFRYLWCPTPGHFDAWRTLDGGRLGDSGAPIFGVKSKKVSR